MTAGPWSGARGKGLNARAEPGEVASHRRTPPPHTAGSVALNVRANKMTNPSSLKRVSVPDNPAQKLKLRPGPRRSQEGSPRRPARLCSGSHTARPEPGTPSLPTPPSSRARLRCNRRAPKPACVRGATGGPPFSVQRSVSSSSRTVHVASTRPAPVERAPYLAALVASSCSARLSASAFSAVSSTWGPERLICDLGGASNGRSGGGHDIRQCGAVPASHRQQVVRRRKRHRRNSNLPGRPPVGRCAQRLCGDRWTVARVFFTR